MRRIVHHGYDKDGNFTIRVSESDPGFLTEEQNITLTRAECQKVSKHMQFGKKGEERVIDTVDGKEI
jgi:hypothetical protein